MSTTQSIELQESQSAEVDADNQSPRATDDSQLEASKRKTLALIGCSILQLPIWGFAMSYGVFQEYYNSSPDFDLAGNVSDAGVVGTTQNGVMYLSMPFLFALFSVRWARYRRTAAVFGIALTTLSFVLSSYSTAVWHLIATQGVMAALGCVLIYSTTTVSLGEYYSMHNRAIAYGITLSSKNITGSTCPFLFRELLNHYGFRLSLRIWAIIAAGSALLAVFLIATPATSVSGGRRSSRKMPWHFLRHPTIYIYSIAIALQSAGYGLPQTYLNTYAHDVASLSQTSSTLLLTIFNVPGIISSSFFGYLSDASKRYSLGTTAIMSISALASGISTFALWGTATDNGSAMALLTMFSVIYGFFAGGYSGTWGGIITEMEREAAEQNEAIDSSTVYGLLNGARGIGFVGGGLAGVSLLKAGSGNDMSGLGYGTAYGPLIVFTGLSTCFGGLGMLRKLKLFG